MRWFHIGETNKNPKATAFLGDIYNPHSPGFDTCFGKDMAKALEYYNKAAELGGYNGMMELAQIYKSGEGVEKNIDKAIMYYEQVANMDCNLAKLACRRLAEIHDERGNKSLAQEWYRRGANLGDSRSAEVIFGGKRTITSSKNEKTCENNVCIKCGSFSFDGERCIKCGFEATNTPFIAFGKMPVVEKLNISKCIVF